MFPNVTNKWGDPILPEVVAQSTMWRATSNLRLRSDFTAAWLADAIEAAATGDSEKIEESYRKLRQYNTQDPSKNDPSKVGTKD